MASILIVDDQPFLGEILAEEMSDEGHHITCLWDADCVMDYVEESKPDIILLDLYLHGFEGWGLLDKIKKYDPSLPIIIVTAYDSFENDPRVAVADAYVIKSVNLDNLKQVIHENLATC